MIKFYNLNGDEITANEANKQYQDFEKNRVIAKDDIGDVLVSTVLISLDYLLDPALPFMFETCVFGGTLDSHIETYRTKEEALEGHKAIVERVKASIKDAAS
jgi:hypothetical protein